MSHPQKMKQQAIVLRKKGFSIIQIAKKYNLAKSTVSLWVSSIPLPRNITLQLKNRELKGREKGWAVMKARRKLAQIEYEKEAKKLLRTIRPLKNKKLLQLLCAIVFWCEGSKRNVTDVRFTNSDPALIRLFLYAFRSAFSVDESKFRALIHIHEYHFVLKQTLFWSKITGIPLTQFTKAYIKPHTAIRKRDNYPGCISLRYGDARIAKRLNALYCAIAQEMLKGA